MILIIDNYDSFTHNLYQMIAKIYPDTKVIRNDEVSVDEIKNLKPKAIVISPGPGRPEDAGICIELIRELAPHIPILGVCLGHQAIGIAFGAKVSSASIIMHGKSSLIFHRRGGIFKGMPLPFSAGRYHSLAIDVNSLPSTLLVEAQEQNGAIMAIRHVEYPCFGVQFHPESILTPQGEILIRQFLSQEAKVC